jgi:alkanesulfonate monooxygenase SsuD/methylene tetrahydromethanopterin reductase-like flavin-dependent oxidoreductase (luciferase family)
MRAWFFSENAYPYLPDAASYDSIRITLPNGLYDPKVGAALYRRYLDEWATADELGLDVMLNEHHASATNLNPSPAVVLGALSLVTKRARILILGNPVAHRSDPVRLAEEMAMVDNYCEGRLEVGFVRGVPYEVFATNSNPVRTSDRMWEAHDLILKAWTTHDGPFNWEGRYFHHRSVNIWPRPYQQPHPPIWVTSGSASSVPPIAERGHVCATFLTGNAATKSIFDTYRQTRAAMGAVTTDDRLAYAALVYVGETDEEGFAGARKLQWYLTSNKVAPPYRNPPGFQTTKTTMAIYRGGSATFDRNAPFDECLENGIIFAGNPDTVYKQIRRHQAYVGGYGHLLIMGQAGFLEHEETVRGISLFAKEVYPRLKDIDVLAAR